MMRNRAATPGVLFCILAILRTCCAQDIDVNECSKSIGCFRHPDDCKAASCKFLLTWKDSGGDSVLFEMSATVDSLFADYVAFGLSKDAVMVVLHRFIYTWFSS